MLNLFKLFYNYTIYGNDVAHSDVADSSKPFHKFQFIIIYKIDFDNMEDVELISKLKKEMFKASKELQFEKAAFLRDKIEELNKKMA